MVSVLLWLCQIHNSDILMGLGESFCGHLVGFGLCLGCLQAFWGAGETLWNLEMGACAATCHLSPSSYLARISKLSCLEQGFTLRAAWRVCCFVRSRFYLRHTVRRPHRIINRLLWTFLNPRW